MSASCSARVICQNKGHSPIHIAVVFTTDGKLTVKFDANKLALLPLDSTDEANSALKTAGHLDTLTDDNVVRGSARPAGGGRDHVGIAEDRV